MLSEPAISFQDIVQKYYIEHEKLKEENVVKLRRAMIYLASNRGLSVIDWKYYGY